MLDPAGERFALKGGAGRSVIAVGGALVAVSPLLPWITVSGLGTHALAWVLRTAGYGALFAWLLGIVGIGLVAAALLEPSLHRVRVTAAVAGLLVGVLGGFRFLGLMRQASTTHGHGLPNLGFFAALAGCALVLLAALKGLASERADEAEGVRALAIPSTAPLALGTIIALVALLMPTYDHLGSSCGLPAAAIFKDKRDLPSSRPPAEVAQVLDRDQTQLDQAKQALAAQGSVTTASKDSQAQADNLSASAQQSSKEAGQASAAVQDAAAAASDAQNQLEFARSAVEQDQGNINYDEQLVRVYQDSYNKDKAVGNDTSADQAALDEARAKLAADQAQLAKDQQTLAAAQSTYDARSNAARQAQQNAEAAANRAASLNAQAQNAKVQAAKQNLTASSKTTSAQDRVKVAQAKLDADSDAWQAQYDKARSTVLAHNASVTSCGRQGFLQLAFALASFGVGLLLSMALGLRSRIARARS